jgi:hypothetical protein
MEIDCTRHLFCPLYFRKTTDLSRADNVNLLLWIQFVHSVLSEKYEDLLTFCNRVVGNANHVYSVDRYRNSSVLCVVCGMVSLCVRVCACL